MNHYTVLYTNGTVEQWSGENLSDVEKAARKNGEIKRVVGWANACECLVDQNNNLVLKCTFCQ